MKRASPLLILIALLAALAWTAVFFDSPGHPKDASFTVVTGDGVERIVTGLKEKGFIRSELLFKAALRSSGLATKLQPGTYDLGGVASYGEIISRLASGGVSAEEFTLRVTEGQDLRDIVAALKNAGYARADELYRVTGLPATDARTLSAAGAPKPKDFSREFPYLKDKPSYVSLEGFLFPDTYRVFRNATPEDIVRLMLANFDRKLTPALRDAMARQGRTVYQEVTMASIIEDEVRGTDDRRLVSDLFWRRLKEGMALQSDATVNYITGSGRVSSTAKDLQNVSPYNTYKYRGLPLGPIGNPGLDSIMAAADPKANAYVYFLTDKQGTVHYARTLAEHNANRYKYLR
ncbi:MAG: endolytic transglycosylase MltG [Candidatus Parcubacteria bacterium]|jgi:UPF0755 protein